MVVVSASWTRNCIDFFTYYICDIQDIISEGFHTIMNELFIFLGHYVKRCHLLIFHMLDLTINIHRHDLFYFINNLETGVLMTISMQSLVHDLYILDC